MGRTFKGSGDVRLAQPGSLACKADEGGMIDFSILHGEVQAGNQSIGAEDSGAMGGERSMTIDCIFHILDCIFPSSYANCTDSGCGKRRTKKVTHHKCFVFLLQEFIACVTL